MNTFQLKLLAVILMVIDHVGYFLYPHVTILRVIGRLSFPLFAFLIVKGYAYTRDKNKYFLRLFIFANIIQIPSLFMIIPINIFYTLSFGLLGIMIIENKKSTFIKMSELIALIVITAFVNPDYSVYGVLLILIIHVLQNKWFWLAIGMLTVSIGYYGYMDIQMFSVFSIIFMYLYNEKKGPSLKYFFYLFYPVHIVFLEWLSQTIR